MEEYNFSHFNDIIRHLKNKNIGIIPTETTYGICGIAMPLDLEVRNKIYDIKKRNFSKNLVLQISQDFDILKIVGEINSVAKKLMDNFFPGPLTLVFKASDEFIINYSWNIDTVAIRIPNHKFLLNLLKAVKMPVFVTSANISGEKVNNNFDYLKNKFINKIDFIVRNDKSLNENLPSTIIDVCDKKIKILRHGSISEYDIMKTINN
ncbi:MAG: threonylcarbamoyl-AMP synthase [Elusimicrobiota bacterium]|jgi:L-threonylcarbamoyladenylate synthase|nr:threonylcarbamoyl-AMP synthase [Elusimicrobiota bacterium]